MASVAQTVESDPSPTLAWGFSTIQLTRTGSTAILSWPVTLTDAHVWSSPDLLNWVRVPDAMQVGNQWVTFDQTPGPMRFYRIK